MSSSRATAWRRGLVALGVSGILLAAGCSDAAPGVVAYVGDAEITQSQLDSAVAAVSSTVQEGQTVSTEAVVNAMIQGELSSQIARDKQIAITDGQRDTFLKTTNLAPLLNVAGAKPVAYDVADQQIVSNKVGAAAYLAEVAKRKVTLNPRYGVLDPKQKTIVEGQTGSLSQPLQQTPLAVVPDSQLERLSEVMAVLRQHCPWDAQQTHHSLVQYLVEECLEVVEAIESGDREHLREELGDLLLQVVFHAAIAPESPDGFDLEDVAAGIADKLVSRHPHVFGDVRSSVSLAELNVTWEQRKAVEKGRTSVLDGIPDRMSAMAKANKVIGRVRSRSVGVTLPAEPIEAADLGAQVLALVARAQSSGIDPEQAVRHAVRELEATVQTVEAKASA